MAPPTHEAVLAALSHIIDPDLHRDVVSLGMIKDLGISPDGLVSFIFELTTPACPVKDRFETQAREEVMRLPGVKDVVVKMTANVRASFTRRPQGPELIPGVRQVIAVASGKGGVGKSTVAANLAVALAATGARVGILDADVYGPSVPVMFGTHAQPEVVDEKLVPLEAHGVKAMSIGFLAGHDKAMIWRGPLASRYVAQMFQDVGWGELDYLLVDLPPGTGDISLTLAQTIPLSGVVIVATPQHVAVGIAVKALTMFRTLNVPCLGLIENMSWYICPSCGHEAHILSHGGAETAAADLKVPFLGAIPLEETIREDADSGRPVVLTHPETPGALAFSRIANALAAQGSIQSFRQLPVLNVVAGAGSGAAGAAGGAAAPSPSPTTGPIAGPAAAGEPMAPVSVDLDRDAQVLRIRWNDGHESGYTGAALRWACPCAECRGEAGGEGRLNRVTELPEAELQLEEMGTVGNYALQLGFRSGHGTGLYSYRLLRSLCSCAECQRGAQVTAATATAASVESAGSAVDPSPEN